MIQRLMKEAKGKRHKVSVVGALEFRRAGKRTLPLKAVKRAFRVGVPAEVLLQP